MSEPVELSQQSLEKLASIITSRTGAASLAAGDYSGSSVASNFGNLSSQISTSARADTSLLGDLSKKLSEYSEKAKEFALSSGGIAQVAADHQLALAALTTGIGSSIKSVRDQSRAFLSLRDDFGSATIGAYDVANSYDLIGGALSKLLPGAASGYIGYLQEAAKKQEYLVVKLKENAAASGQLDDLYQRTNGFKNMAEYASAYVSQLVKVQQATNAQPDDVIKLGVALTKIKGAYDAVVSGSQLGIEGNASFMASSMTLAKGVGMSTQELTQTLTRLRESNNLAFDEPEGGQKALGFIASSAKAANLLGVDQRSLRDSILNTAESFRFYGNNAEGATLAISSLSLALEKTGLSGQNAVSIAKDFAGGIGQMTVAQKAYLSQTTGGPGGAFGAFLIDEKLRSGKKEDLLDVFKMTQESLKQQMGGSIISRQDVKDEETAQIRERQIANLMSGPLGQFAKTHEEASKLLDAMSKSSAGDDSLLREISGATEEAYKRGKKEEERTLGPEAAARTAAMASEATAMNAAYTLAEAARGNEAVTPFGKAEKPAWKDPLIESKRDAEKKAAISQTSGPISETTGREVVVENVETAKRAVSAATEAATAQIKEASESEIAKSAKRLFLQSGIGGASLEAKDLAAVKGEGLAPAVQGVARTGGELTDKEKESREKAQREADASTPGSIMFECPSCHAKQMADLKGLVKHLSGHTGAVKGRT